MAFTSLLLDTSTGSVTSGMGSYISDLSKTIGVDLFEEDIDNVVFRTNEFLCSADFIGSDLNRIASELDKLILALPKGEQTITVDWVKEHIGISKNFNNFELVDALANKDVLKANRIAK